ncbi:MAG: bile acid:sodium symporter family protein [Desulfomonilaceae bacterium]
MRRNDVILLLVIFFSSLVAILSPDLCRPLQRYPLYLMMLLMFLSFLRINFGSLFDTSAKSLKNLILLVLFKLAILPTILFWVTSLFLPDFAIPVLILSGISTGVVAPFIATLFDSDVASVLRMVVITSLLAPFSLPIIIKALVGAKVEIPLGLMAQILAMVIFIPLLAVILARRFFENGLEKLFHYHYPISLVIFTAINLGVFSKYSNFFFQNPHLIFLSLIIAYILSLMYYLAGFLLASNGSSDDRIASGISFGVMNNVLVIVFSSQFFGPLSPTLAAMYMFPLFSMIIPIKILGSKLKWLSQNVQES